MLKYSDYPINISFPKESDYYRYTFYKKGEVLAFEIPFNKIQSRLGWFVEDVQDIHWEAENNSVLIEEVVDHESFAAATADFYNQQKALADRLTSDIVSESNRADKPLVHELAKRCVEHCAGNSMTAARAKAAHELFNKMVDLID